jgi:hypothetical protein
LLLFFGLIWSGLTLGFDFYWASAVYRQFAALGYPTVDGVVTSSKVVVVPSGRRSTTAPKINYSFRSATRNMSAIAFAMDKLPRTTAMPGGSSISFPSGGA